MFVTAKISLKTVTNLGYSRCTIKKKFNLVYIVHSVWKKINNSKIIITEISPPHEFVLFII